MKISALPKLKIDGIHKVDFKTAQIKNCVFEQKKIILFFESFGEAKTISGCHAGRWTK